MGLENSFHIKCLVVKKEREYHGRVEAILQNISGVAVPPAVLLLNFYDPQGRIRDRVNIALKEFRAGEERTVSVLFRLKNDEFFAYKATIQAVGGPR